MGIAPSEIKRMDLQEMNYWSKHKAAILKGKQIANTVMQQQQSETRTVKRSERDK